MQRGSPAGKAEKKRGPEFSSLNSEGKTKYQKIFTLDLMAR